MLNYKLKILLIIIVITASTYTLAANNPAMETFYADENNKMAFDNAVKTGMMQKGREQMMAMCIKDKATNKSLDCECLKKELDKITDKEMFYDSVISYREYQERVQAARDNNQEKLDQLKQKHAKRKGIGKKIDNACGNK